MQNGDHFQWFKIKPLKKKQGQTEKDFQDFEQKYLKEEQSYETISRGKLADKDVYKMIKPTKVVAGLIFIIGAKKGIDFVVK